MFAELVKQVSLTKNFSFNVNFIFLDWLIIKLALKTSLGWLFENLLVPRKSTEFWPLELVFSAISAPKLVKFGMWNYEFYGQQKLN